jgi:pentatricopeptide repeat protein
MFLKNSQDVEFALSLMDELQQRQLAPDVFTFNALIKVVSSSGDFETVGRLLHTMEVRK